MTRFTRRGFLGSAAAAAGVALAPALPARAAAKGTLRLGVASYSMRKFSLDQAVL